MILFISVIGILTAVFLFDYAFFLEDMKQKKPKTKKERYEYWKPIVRALVEESRKERRRRKINR